MSLLILTIILAAFAATSAFLEIEKGSKYFIARNISIAFFFIGTATASIFQFRSAEADSLKLNKQDSAFAKSQTDIIELQKSSKRESDSLDKVIIALNNRLSGKTEDLLRSTRQAKDIQTEYINYSNGANLPELGVMSRFKKYFSIYFLNKSKYPIYNARIRVTDFESVLKSCYPNIIGNTAVYNKFCYDKLLLDQNIGIIPTKSSYVFEVYYEITETDHYLIDFYSTNKWYKFFFIASINGDYLNYTYRVYEVIDNYKLKFLKEIKKGRSVNNKYWEEKFLLKYQQKYSDW